jgi:hypothetical protein
MCFVRLRLGALALVITVVALVGCEREVAPRLATSGIDREAVQIDIKALGKLTEQEIADKRAYLGIDGIYRVAAGTCSDGCDWAQVSVYIENRSTERMAPPVVRVDTPKGKPIRPPLGLGADRIDPGRIGRIRWLIEMYPEEQNVDIRLSSSVFFEVNEPATSQADDPKAE